MSIALDREDEPEHSQRHTGEEGGQEIPRQIAKARPPPGKAIRAEGDQHRKVDDADGNEGQQRRSPPPSRRLQVESQQNGGEIRDQQRKKVNGEPAETGRRELEPFPFRASHSHSIVAGGFGVMSQTTRLAPFTFVAIFSATMVTNLNGSSTMPALTNCCVEMARMPMT